MKVTRYRQAVAIAVLILSVSVLGGNAESSVPTNDPTGEAANGSAPEYPRPGTPDIRQLGTETTAVINAINDLGTRIQTLQASSEITAIVSAIEDLGDRIRNAEADSKASTGFPGWAEAILVAVPGLISVFLLIRYRTSLSLADQVSNTSSLLIGQYGDKKLPRAIRVPAPPETTPQLPAEVGPRLEAAKELATGLRDLSQGQLNADAEEKLECLTEALNAIGIAPRGRLLRTIKEGRLEALKTARTTEGILGETQLRGFLDSSEEEGSWQRAVVAALSVAQNRVGTAVLSGILPIRFVLGLYAIDIIEDWILCSNYVKKLRGAMQVEQGEGDKIVSPSRRHAEWLSTAAAIHVMDTWGGQGLEHRVSEMARRLGVECSNLKQLRERELVLRSLEERAGLVPRAAKREIKRFLRQTRRLRKARNRGQAATRERRRFR